MIRIVIPESSTPRRLPFYLAVEEWVAENLPASEYFFTWVVNPTVIFGRNQCAQLEVDLEYCRDHNIEVYRRRSGGGCVYADRQNLMMSYITPSTQVESTFASYTRRVTEVLRGMGLDAEATGRNDVLIAGRKVSGNAFYHRRDRSIAHGTLLLRADTDTMCHAITPSKSKLESKQVKSVDSRITSISEYLPDLTIDELEQYINQQLCSREYRLTDADMAQIKGIENGYYDLKWIFGRRGPLAYRSGQVHTTKRIEGVGQFDVIMQHTPDGVIDEIEITGDYFLLADLDTGIFDKIKGIPRQRDLLEKALTQTDTSKVIAGLTTTQFIDLIT